MPKESHQTYLLKRENYYYFRITVPKKHRALLGRAEYKKALRTKDYKIARRLCWRMGDAAEEYICNTEIVRQDPKAGYDKELLEYMKSESKARISHYKALKEKHDFDEEQEHLAKTL